MGYDSISVHIESCPRDREKEKRYDRQENEYPNNPHPSLLQAEYALALTLSKLIGQPGTESYRALCLDLPLQ